MNFLMGVHVTSSAFLVDLYPPIDDLAIATGPYLILAREAARNGDYSTAITQYESVYAMYNTAVGPLHFQTQIAINSLMETTWNMRAHNEVLHAFGLLV
jgi:hypothetical protein